MRFRVTNQYGKSPEDIVAEFKNQADAERFILGKVEQDATMRIKVIYRLYDSLDLVKEYDASTHTSTGSASSGSSSSSGQGGKQASFRPTPLNTAPTPPGLPKNWWKDSDEEDKDK